ncbi:MAG TPA: cysteine desulfurase family protein [Bacillota bacterium]
MGEVYLDNSATTRVDPQVAEAMSHAAVVAYGNPSSPHRKGLEAEHLVRDARAAAARALGGVEERTILFTSGGTEANNLAVFGAARAAGRRGRHVVTTAVEHSSVLEACLALRDEGFDVTVLPVGGDGRLRVEDLEAALRDDTVLVSVMHVNNEVGAVQPVAEIAERIRRRRRDGRYPILHVDAVQSLGKLALKPREWGVDLMTLSAHKIHGPKGVGALYVAEGVRLAPLLYGGDQQGGLRPGTENVPGIAGFGRALELAVAALEDGAALRMAALRAQLLDALRQAFPDLRVNGPTDAGQAAPHIVNVSFAGVRGEVLVHALAERGIYVSTGSACHSRRGVVSHVIKALNVPERYAQGTLRISLSRHTTAGEIDRLVAALAELVPALAAFTGRR